MRQRELQEPKGGLEGKAWCSEKFRGDLRGFLEGKVKAYREVRVALGLPAEKRGEGPGAQSLEYVAGCVGLTQQELEFFVRRCLEKYEAKRVDPGGSQLGMGVCVVNMGVCWYACAWAWVLGGGGGLTQQELGFFVRCCLEKYEAKRVDPGRLCQRGGQRG